MQILFENDDVLVINKPAGLMVHADGKREGETLVDWILRERPEIAGVGEPMIMGGNEGSEESEGSDRAVIDRPGIVHRLDAETSGALLIAKNQSAFEHLKSQFQNHTIQKEYHAFVWGTFSEREGIVDTPIGRSPNDFRRRLAGRGARGEMREAITKWVVAGSATEAEGEAFSFMHLFPKTGRTHQLRVHMKYLQHPIVSDPLYAPTKPGALGFTRLALHARSITFTLPSPAGSGDQKTVQKTVTAPYPEDFETAIARTMLL